MVKPIYQIKFRKINYLMMKERLNMWKKLSLVIGLLPILYACNLADWSPINKSPEFLRHPDGQIIRQCDGSGIPLRNGAPERF